MPQFSLSTWQLIILGLFLLVYVGLIFGAIFFARSARKTRWPFKESERLLRGPGESLRRKIIEFDEAFVFELCGGIVAIALTWPLAVVLGKLLKLPPTLILGLVVVSVFATMLGSVWRVRRLWRKRSKYYLGWYGERMVAEALVPLQAQGYRVFHDVPAETGKNGFNLDHVVVGPTGVTVIEVKSRRKGNAKAGNKDHEVKFDGTRLHWPSGPDSDSVDQAINESEWLAKWIDRNIGRKLSVKAILTVPGWYVHESPSPAIRVVNPTFLPAVIRGRGDAVLSAEVIDLISRQLDRICRDVAD